MEKIFNIVFPFWENYKYNKTIKNKLIELGDDLDKSLLKLLGDHENKYEILDFDNEEVIINEYNKTLEIKNTLENKAKTNLVVFSVVISLILGLSVILKEIYMEYSNLKTIKNIVFILSIVSVLYLVLATIILVHMLNHENIIYGPNLLSLKLEKDDNKLLEQYLHYTYYNRQYNLIRNNNVYTSYECIRNSIVGLVIIFIISVIPSEYILKNNTENSLKISYSYNIKDKHKEDVVKFFTNENNYTFCEKRDYNLIDNIGNIYINGYWDGEWFVIKEIHKLDN